MPNFVEVALITERKQVDGADVVWRSQSSNATGTVLYLVSSRYSVGRHFSEAETSSWQIVMQARPLIFLCDVADMFVDRHLVFQSN
jgi:hypothetical protein